MILVLLTVLLGGIVVLLQASLGPSAVCSGIGALLYAGSLSSWMAPVEAGLPDDYSGALSTGIGLRNLLRTKEKGTPEVNSGRPDTDRRQERRRRRRRWRW